MYPDDRVLVGVIKSKRDLFKARDEHWYRIPRDQMPKGVHAEYLAFFTSGRSFKAQSGGIHYYAKMTGGIELAYRRELVREQPNHPRADEVYYRVSIDEVISKTPPVLNIDPPRPISFIMTTWDRFIAAQKIADLYSKKDYFVDRIYHALRNKGISAYRYWDAEQKTTGYGAHLQIACKQGTIVASPDAHAGNLVLREGQSEDEVLAAIRAEVARAGGLVTMNVPLEGL